MCSTSLDYNHWTTERTRTDLPAVPKDSLGAECSQLNYPVKGETIAIEKLDLAVFVVLRFPLEMSTRIAVALSLSSQWESDQTIDTSIGDNSHVNRGWVHRAHPFTGRTLISMSRAIGSLQSQHEKSSLAPPDEVLWCVTMSFYHQCMYRKFLRWAI